MTFQRLLLLGLTLTLFAISDGQNKQIHVCIPKFIKTSGIKMDGGIEIPMKITTNCADECLSLSGCLGFDFSVRTSPPICTLFLEKKNMTTVLGVDHYEIDRTKCAPHADTVTECMPRNSIEFYKEMLGGRHIANQPYKKCLDTCYANQDCIGFNFDLDAQMNFAASDCYILTKNGTVRRNDKSFIYRIIKNNACQKHSPESTRCLSTYEISLNKRMGIINIGHSFTAEPKNLTECATLCLQQPSCLAFNFDKNTHPTLCQIVNSSLPLNNYTGIDNYLLKRNPCSVPITTTTTKAPACNIPNCVICNKNSDKCVLCDVRFGLNTFSKCVACRTNCYLCLFDANVCTNCLNPTVYKLIGGECKLEATTRSATTTATLTKGTTTIAPTSKGATTIAATTKSTTTIAPTKKGETTIALTTKGKTTITPTTKVKTTTIRATTIALTTEGATTIAATTKGAITIAPTTTTIAPSTKGKTNIAPTTIGLTIIASTTKVATTIAVTTKGETTIAPSTKGATTIAPTTKGETTIAATTKGETTIAPSTKGATTIAPTTKGATTIASTTQGATTIAPTTKGGQCLSNSKRFCLNMFGIDLSSPYTCKKCAEKNCYHCNNDYNVCNVCKQGFRLDANNKCIECADTNCSNCLNNENDCQICKLGYKLVQTQCLKLEIENCLEMDGNTCFQCKEGFRPQNNECIECSIPNCKECLSRTCDKCLDGWVFEGSTCKKCAVDNCRVCYISSACHTCSPGFYLENNTCKEYCVNCIELTGSMACSHITPGFGDVVGLYVDKCESDSCKYCFFSFNECLVCSNGFVQNAGECLIQGIIR